MKGKISVLLCIILFAVPATHGKDKWWGLYFTSPHQKAFTPNPEAALAQFIGRARLSVDAALYDLKSPVIVKKLIAAKKRGVKVRLVTEGEHLKKKSIVKLQRQGIPVVGDSRGGLMHNKFVIVDKKILWTGSYNVTPNGSQRNNNNAIAIASKELAKIFTLEFEEMFRHRIFGNKKDVTPLGGLTQKYYVAIGKSHINAYFSPDNDVERIILKRIKKAKSSIEFMAFSFTSDAIGEAMIRAAKRGVKVRGIFEKRGSNSKYSEYKKMKVEGLPVKIDRNKYVLHHKVIIIDSHIVITGSYNFSKNASRNNDENLLIIDNPAIAAMYGKEFRRLY